MANRARIRVGQHVEWLAVVGGIAQALLYCAIGVTAIRAAMNVHYAPDGMAGALKEMAAGVIGRTTVGLVALAFTCIAAARFIEAWRGRVRHLGSARALAVRVWSVVVALMYVGFAVWAVRYFFQPATPADERTSDWAALLIAQPFGAWLLAGVGVLTIAFGVHQLITAVPQHCPRWMRYCSLYGRVSLALLLILIGGSATIAAGFRSPIEARGVSGALTYLQHQLLGPVMLGGIGVGLLLYGVFSAVEAVRNPSAQVNVAV